MSMQDTCNILNTSRSLVIWLNLSVALLIQQHSTSNSCLKNRITELENVVVFNDRMYMKLNDFFFC